MPSPAMWLVAALFTLVVAVGSRYYYMKHVVTAGETDKKVHAAKTASVVAAATFFIMLFGYIWAKRSATQAAVDAASGIPQVDPNAPQAIQELQRLQIESLKAASAIRARGEAEAAALEAKAGRAETLLGKARNLQAAGALT